MKRLEEHAEEIISSNIYMTIATASENGKPWASPVFFAHDEDFNLYWVSYKEATHSRNIHGRKEIGIVVFDSTLPEGKGEGIYFDAVAKALDDDNEIRKAMEILSARVTIEDFKIKRIEDVTVQGAWRVYKAEPHEITKVAGDTVNGQYIDTRENVILQ